MMRLMNAALPIEVDPEVMSGAPVFAGTRVPVETFFEAPRSFQWVRVRKTDSR